MFLFVRIQNLLDMATFYKKLRTTLKMIKFEHTIFALPFAFLGAMLAADGLPTLYQIFWITIAMIGARSAAMSFNRILDRDIDAANPRTASREIPSGQLSIRFAWWFMLVSCACFFLASFMLNRLTLILSPIALISILGYSYAKRFTSLAHIILGWALSIAPTGAWIAVRGNLDSPIPFLLSLFVLLWTAGFDILYSCQDYEFDRATGLNSIPARFGISGALWISRGLHLVAFLVLIALYFVTQLGLPVLIGIFATGALMFYQQWIIRADDLSRMNAAFFTSNAFVSVILFFSFSLGILINQ